MLLVITPYDKGSLADIERAIKGSDLGINPTNDGNVIRLAFPSLTEERRKELVKVVRHKAEEGKVAVRNLRRDGRQELEALQKDGSLSTDELERVEKDVEKMTHEQVGTIDHCWPKKNKNSCRCEDREPMTDDSDVRGPTPTSEGLAAASTRIRRSTVRAGSASSVPSRPATPCPKRRDTAADEPVRHAALERRAHRPGPGRARPRHGG